MIKNIIEEFKQKYQGFNLEEFFDNYLAGNSREVLCTKHNISEMPLRMFMQGLGLSFPKSRRQSSFEDYKYRLGLENNIEDTQLVKELEKDINILSEKNRKLYQSLTLARDENNALRKESRQEAREEDEYETTLEMFNNVIKEMKHLPPEVYVIKSKPKATQREGLVLVLSDEHFGSVETEEVSNNNFNYGIAKRRLDYMVDKVLTNPLQSYNLIVLELLDVLQGLIHNSEYLSEGGFTTAMVKVVEVYVDMYSKLSPAYDRIDVYVTGDNHSRTTQKPSSYMKWDNFGIMTMKMVEMVLKAKGLSNIHFHFTSNEYHLLRINDVETLVFHGDTLRRYNPTSQVERANLQTICLGIYGKPYKHAISGHIHKSNASMNEYGGYNISNGTLVGNGQYGVSNGFASINASQTILYFDAYGDIEQISFVNLSMIQ